ncbi:MAG TPA: nuclear transport factor 2 family protein [Lachnoclostridium sp.]|uniref:SnoaL-like protein n=1 Tax=[Clostridium] celerecrescens 18A TaxID=1286362 RepID=A0A2M8Z1P7_9FIRM|nr:nuclear transport factor 2 family protein [Lacrimispora celerecrescens]PJJ27352.1 SnoaL-like protein [[Clostridium] celerecrescens 18A]HBE84841.1 nuclear transport factor 2 family protein [Lachnoclostridium sp.]
MWNKKLVERYFQAWIEKDADVLKTVFSDDIIYSECYGPEYHGIEQVLKWFADWNKAGTVLEWSIKRFVSEGNTIVVEWYFKCDYNNLIDGFDGVSMIDFDVNRKIKGLKEFQSKADHYFPYEK